MGVLQWEWRRGEVFSLVLCGILIWLRVSFRALLRRPFVYRTRRIKVKLLPASSKVTQISKVRVHHLHFNLILKDEGCPLCSTAPQFLQIFCTASLQRNPDISLNI